ncbi:ANTAR domain-containing protein [Acidisoma cellulosilytica]|uniref:ANTAR domain-containing protein n=1 Tax=Acidisoma cellulosilyticum TaxID=2802395 RepID=A0A963Z6D8_9PROT|nr:ANTAR domain-containing protein [Acidisoma cellulosilyticum]MCB8883630.1 ANTAR domain-containing protein [Acidisoma cellulosilyticum]
MTMTVRDPDEGLPLSHDGKGDLLFVDGDFHPKGMERPEEAALWDVPVIGLVGIEAPGRLRALMALGATAFLRKPVYAPAVYPAVFLAVNTHRERQHMREQLVAHERRRAGRRFVIKAVIAVMQDEGCDDEQAYEMLRRAAMQERQSIEVYCEIWVQKSISEQAHNLGQAKG